MTTTARELISLLEAKKKKKKNVVNKKSKAAEVVDDLSWAEAPEDKIMATITTASSVG